MQTITTRFPPSPTGYLHIGGLRTVLYNYLFAKKNNGKFMLRIEDTDRNRLVKGSAEDIIKILEEFGLKVDEGPNNPGEKGPYYQSQRLDIYSKYVKKLIENDKAYYCFCSSERLEKLREEQSSLGLSTKYDEHCKYLSEEEINEKLKEKIPHTIRLKIPKNREIIFEDSIKGKIKVHSKDIDEQILLKSDKFPTYHLANVIDDHLMGITHVIRGDEWTPSTPKHVLIYEAFGWQQPVFAHIPLLLGTNKKKLSKRTGDVSVESYLEKGYLKEAIINYIALLGWNPKTTEEFFTIEELIEKFELKQVHKSGAIFDIERLNFFSSHYIKDLNIDILYDKYIKYLSQYNKDFLKQIQSFSEDYNKKILNELKTKIKKFDEFEGFTHFFYSGYKIPNKNLFLNEKMKITSIEGIKKALNIATDIIENNNDLGNIENIKNIFIEKIKENDMKNGQVLRPVRVALSGEQFSLGALELILILGKEKSIKRIKKVLNEL